MRGRTARRMIWAILLIVLLAVLVPPFVNVNRYRKRVAEAISRALGREVTVSRIELKLLPRPGIVLSNFVVAENPTYGARRYRHCLSSPDLTLARPARDRDPGSRQSQLEPGSPSRRALERGGAGGTDLAGCLGPHHQNPSGSTPALSLCRSLERAN